MRNGTGGTGYERKDDGTEGRGMSEQEKMDNKSQIRRVSNLDPGEREK